MARKRNKFKQVSNRLDRSVESGATNFIPSVIRRSNESLNETRHDLIYGIPIKKLKVGESAFSPKKKKKSNKLTRLEKYAKKLNNNLPKSEKWFQDLWRSLGFIDDEFNSPFGKYIPDVINRKYKYIIEIDGNFHNLEIQKFKDRRKDAYYNQRRFKVFRIKAFDLSEYKQVLLEVLKIRNEFASISPVQNKAPKPT